MKKNNDSQSEYDQILDEGLEEEAEARTASTERKLAANEAKSRSKNSFIVFLSVLTAISVVLYFSPFLDPSDNSIETGPSPEIVQENLQQFHQEQMDALPIDAAAQPVIEEVLTIFPDTQTGKSDPITGDLINAINEELQSQGVSPEDIQRMLRMDPDTSSIVVNR